MKTRSRLMGSAAAICLWLVACSSSSGGSSFPQDPYAKCFSDGAPGNCDGCLNDSCSSQLVDFEKACPDYLTCACPGGDYSSSAAATPSCMADITGNSVCNNAAESMLTCIKASCGTPCGV